MSNTLRRRRHAGAPDAKQEEEVRAAKAIGERVRLLTPRSF
jgi:hypothetical protein